MSDDLIERLRDFTEEDAYAMPWTFGAVVREAADELARLRAEVERLTAALSTVQRAARTLHAAGQEITRNAVAAAMSDAAALREVDRTEYTAAANLDSERQANAMLTEALERAEAALSDEQAHADALAEALDRAAGYVEGPMADRIGPMVRQCRAALAQHRARRQG